jgi:DNA-binding response OmpR family regulator
LASVLIVEDDFLLGDHLASVVEAMGHDVIDVAANAEDAIAAAERHPPDLVLADVELGSAMSGLETVAVIRGHDRVPAVYVTAFPERVLAAERDESTFVVTKPFDEQRLKVAMTTALRPAVRTPAG